MSKTTTIINPRRKKIREKFIPLFRDERIFRKKLIEAKNSFKTEYNWTISYENPYKNAVDSAKEHFFYTEAFRRVMGFSKAAILFITKLFYKDLKHRKYNLSIGEKLLAIAVLKQNPKAYRLLRSVFTLPTPETLVKLLKNPRRQTGLNNNKIMKLLKEKAKCLFKEDRVCSLLFGQTKLKTKLTHKITKSSLPHYVQIFMIKCIKSRYKQTVTCTLSHGPKTGPELAEQIKTIIFKLRKAGFRVLATISDHSNHNRSAVKHLKKESKRIFQLNKKEVKQNVFLVNPQEVIPIFDPPQLLIGLRNQFVTKDIVFTKNGKQLTAKWEHILLLNEHTFIKKHQVLHKVSKKHLTPAKVDKVKYASQVFSNKVGAFMALMSGNKTSLMPTESRDTAELIMFLNSLFDSLNGNKRESDYNDYKMLLRKVKYNSPHHKLWKDAVKVFKSMSFGKDGDKVSVTEIKCWIDSLNGVEALYWKFFEKYGVRKLWMRRVNMDPLTNLLKAVRGD